MSLGGSSVLEARTVCKGYGPTAVLADVDLRVRAGEVVAVTGANGTGKSTLLRCLVGRERVDSGEVLLDGAPLQPHLPATGAAVAAALGADSGFLDLTVREHLEFVARAHGNAAPDAVVGAVLADLSLAAVQDRFPHAVSQGQRRRLELAACLVRPHRVLVLDEPEQNLDAQGRDWLVERVLGERAAGVAVVLASHHQGIVDRLADSEVRLAGADDDPDVLGSS